MLNPVYLYILTDPNTESCYIGATEHPKRRLSQHLGTGLSQKADPRTTWLREIRENSIPLTLTILDVLIDETLLEVAAAERDAINMVKAIRGKSCLNKDSCPLYTGSRETRYYERPPRLVDTP